MAICMALWLDFKKYMPASRWNYIDILFAFGVLNVPIVLGYTRLFLGVHSLNQVWFGWSLGAWFAVSSHYLVKNDFTNYI